MQKRNTTSIGQQENTNTQSLSKKLDEYPESRCASLERCIDLVKEGNKVFIH